MNDRLRLRKEGETLQSEILGQDARTRKNRDLDLFEQDFVFGRVWSRPGLSRKDRMIATLSALCVGRRYSAIEKYVAAALDSGLEPQAINEIFFQCGIYAGFCTVSDDCLKLAEKVFKARGVALPEDAERDDSLGVLASRGTDVMTQLHAERKHNDYANPDNSITASFYPDVVQFCYGEIWQRPGLGLRERAICAVASFTALTYGGLVAKFSKSAINVGLKHAEVVEVIIQTAPYTGIAPVLMGLSVINGD